jgi:hypothetical protein
MLRYVKKSYRLGGNTNSSSFALIPKEENPSTFSRFRPISLCNVSLQNNDKDNENRLREVLPKIIFENQGGFL